ncbi:MAG: ATP-dependent DNA ligase [Planctomycetota bacterium]
MRRFTELFERLDASNATNAKMAALRDYFTGVDPRSGAWALSALMGRKLVRGTPSRLLRRWAAQRTGYPSWLIDRSYSVVGDLSETLSLILPDEEVDGTDEPLWRVVEDRVLPLGVLPEEKRRAVVEAAWAVMDRRQRFVYHKLISTAFRVGVSKKLVTRALAEVAGVEPAEMAHRLSGSWQPTGESFAALLSGEGLASDGGRPYPFCLAYALDLPTEQLGSVTDWRVEWKWDGIRGQVIRREGKVWVWSRGEELVTEAFPEVVQAVQALPRDVVLDGELLAWGEQGVGSFADLQTRIGRKRVELTLFDRLAVRFMAYDVLELDGVDLRSQTTDKRRAELDDLLVDVTHGLDGDSPIGRSPLLEPASWGEVEALKDSARERGTEGVMLKRRDAVYEVGRVRGGWFKWKVDPYTVDAVLVQAEQGSGRRAGLFTAYTFACWRDGELVPVTRAYSGLTNDEIESVDRWVRGHTVGRHGPVRVVEPARVFEIGFEGLARSDRHRSGVALRFPRMLRIRDDKAAADADRLETLEAMLR